MHVAVSCPDALSGFLEVAHRLFENGVFVCHDKSIRISSVLRSVDCFTCPREHEDIVDGVAAGKHRIEVEDFDFSYAQYVDGGRVTCFADGRTGHREWARRNGRLADIHSLDDRYDHDVDELMV
jgi:hypothetical protein